MTIKAVAPTVEKGQIGAGCNEHEVFTHPAFGIIRISCVQTSKGDTLFGSNVGHPSYLSIDICPAEMHRNLSRDWIHQKTGPVVSFKMTHDQFARFITSMGRAEGTPVTLERVGGGAPVDLPEIARMPSKQDLLRNEIRQSVGIQLEKLTKQRERLAALIESGKLSKKELKDIAEQMRHLLSVMPSNLDFVLASAEEALETATENARSEVDAYINARTQSLGLKALKDLGSDQSRPALGVGESSVD